MTATSPGLTSATSDPFTVLEDAVLGSAGRYSVLAATGVASTGDTTVSGDLGVSPSSSVTGFPPGVAAW